MRNGKKILVVEDNDINQKVVMTFLKKLGYDVALAENGQEAIDFYFKNPDNFYVIFMDIMMPVMDGWIASRKIREFEEENKLEPIVIVAMTAKALATDRDNCLNVGMTDFLSKPFRMQDLQDIILKNCK